MKNLAYQFIIATVIFSLSSVKYVTSIDDTNVKVKNKNVYINEYEDVEINASDEDLNEEYDKKLDDSDSEDDVVDDDNQSQEEPDQQQDDEFKIKNQTEMNSDVREMYMKLKRTNLNLYRKLSVNDMFININGDENESKNDNLIIKAYYKDDIQYDCELPEEYDSIELFDWSVNGYMTGMNESSYNIVLDKKIDSKSAFLNVSCMFKLLNQTDMFQINFPIVHLG